MKTIAKMLLTGAFAMAAISAHASDRSDGAKETCFKYSSRAWCAYAAAGLSKNVADMRKKDVVNALNGDSNLISGETALDLGMIGATLAGVFTPAPGFSNGGEAAMLALNLLLRTSTPGIARANMVFAWLPYEMAASPQEAARKVTDLIDEGSRNVFKDHTFETVTMGLGKDEKAYSLDRIEFLAYAVKGGECDSADCVLIQDRPHLRDFYVGINRPVEQTAPEWLGGYKAWLVSGQLLRELRVNGNFVSQLYAGKLSKQLPKWAFVSVTPQSRTSDFIGPVNMGQRLPVLFNEGKPMVTVYPELQFQPDDSELHLVKPKVITQADVSK